tara:strand:+ start:315 stop:1016 length:702 start_codon:yes stop_codon:yes gene_type:complete
MNSIKKKIDLVILAGGKGKRLRTITKNKVPKPLVKINGKPFLDLLLQNLSKYNFDNIFILCGYKGYQILKKYNKKKINNKLISCVIEKKPMGTGGALKNIKNKISKKFLLVNGDTFFKINYNLILNYNLGNKSGLMLLTNSKENSLTNKLNNLSLKNGKVKFSKRSKMINSGVYLFKHKIIEKINSYKGKQISLENDVLKNLIMNGKICGLKKKGYFIDIGTRRNYTKAKKYF